MSEKIESYYRENLPLLIGKLKKVATNLLSIIEETFDTDLSDDKMFNALKGKRQAADDYLYYLKKIDELEDELAGKAKEEEVGNVTKKFAKN